MMHQNEALELLLRLAEDAENVWISNLRQTQMRYFAFPTLFGPFSV